MDAWKAETRAAWKAGHSVAKSVVSKAGRKVGMKAVWTVASWEF